MGSQRTRINVDMKRPDPLPKKIIRLDDGMEFILNETAGLYRVHLGIPHLDDPTHLHHEYEYERLINNETVGFFKVADGTEDIQAMKKDWMKRFERQNRSDGHGNEE